MTESPPMETAVRVRRSRRRVAGSLIYCAGCALLLAAVIAGFALTRRPPGPFVVAIAAVLCLVFGLTLLVVAETFFMPSATEVLARDRRPPVVFLRPFDEDAERTYDVISTGETSTTITAKAEDFLLALNAVGPLISIAQPSRLARWGMHPFGAYRDFIGAGDWQARVTNWLDRAGMVVLAMGDSPGIEWEIAQVRRHIRPQSLLVYLPPRPVEAWTRKGRHEKERAIYAHFAPLVEKHFGIVMPPFRAATYLIGFAADGTPVMAPDAARRRWTFTEYGRVADAIRRQLGAVLAQVRTDARPGAYPKVGRAGRWGRIAGAVLVALAGIGVGLSGLPAGAFLALGASSLIDLALVIGWGLLAHHFRRRWVWAIPVLLGLLVLVNGGAQLYLQIGGDAAMLFRHPGYLVPLWLLRLGYAGAVLTLGIVTLGRPAPPD
ncbi:hypothetical protein G3580_07060 [Nitrogeniibacter mangrovi]|uniref:Uncharacterized protein n=1 Tax=Nitrogeniibacter mangrovi TaxID=2016596 RepID=A0A6C1B1C7_9RHOO|nr:hypothetical protein [Nitrogeniibacter mangrovi]QID17426.1 hypothetical protein G3580_07060 [Nitrogeniibacter mangrovi]